MAIQMCENTTTVRRHQKSLAPFIQTNYERNSTVIKYLEGYEGEIIQTIVNYLNLTLDIIDCHMKWGNKQKDGSWTGLVGAVHEKVIYSF